MVSGNQSKEYDETTLRSRDHYCYSTQLATRWIDNDVYGHINNANYYQFFDTVVNEYLMDKAGLDITTSSEVAYVVASSCQYRKPLAHPDMIHAAMRVNFLGQRSVEYGVALFSRNYREAAAFGTFTHVFVERVTGKAVPLPAITRRALEAISL